MSIRSITLLAALFYAMPSSAMEVADTPEFNDELEWLHEETTVISASRVLESIKKSAASVSIIDEQRIQSMAAESLWDILKQVPGLGVQQSRIMSKKIESRGIQTLFSEKILVMLDGHSLDSNLVNGGTPFFMSHFPLTNVARIEIVRGPVSALYGANAFVALINVISKTASEIDHSQVTVSHGSNNTEMANLIFRHSKGKFAIVANAYIRDTEGSSAEVEQDVVGNAGFTTPTLKTQDIDLRLNYANVELRAKYHEQQSGSFWGFTGALVDENAGDMDSSFLQFKYQDKITESTELTFRIYYDEFNANNYWELFPEKTTLGPYTYPEGYVAFSGSTNAKYGSELMANWKVNSHHRLITGINYELQDQTDITYKATYDPLTNEPNDPPTLLDYSDATHTWAPDVDRDFYALFLEDLYDITDSVRMIAGLRHDNYSDFGGTTNPRVGITWAATPNITVKGVQGRAFRAPTFAELYNINNPAVVGNPNLQPETIKTSEAGLHFDYPEYRIKSEVTLYYNDIKDLIQIDGGTYVNSEEVTTRGVESELSFHLTRGSYVKFNYTYTDARDDQDNRLANIARHRGNLLINWRATSHINLFWDSYFQGKIPRIAADTRDEMSGYGVSGATLVYTNIVPNLDVKLRINNLFDKEYSSPSDLGFVNDDYEQPERNGRVELSYRF